MLRRDPSKPQKAGRKLTMREWMVANVLTGEWQAVSGINLQTGIPDQELAGILDLLVEEGYAEKAPDNYRSGWSVYRGTSQWLQFKGK
jgi:hypothetical protein